MKIINIINSLDRTNKTLESTPDWVNISNQLGINQFDWSDDTRLKSYYIAPHYCTDSYVGLRAYFLDDEFIAISQQNGRKSDEEFKFVSEEAATKARNYILSLTEYRSQPIFSPESDIGEGYEVEYSGQLLPQFHKFATYKTTEERVEIIGAANDYKRFHLVEIKFDDGREQKDDVRNLRFEYGKCYENSRIKRL